MSEGKLQCDARPGISGLRWLLDRYLLSCKRQADQDSLSFESVINRIGVASFPEFQLLCSHQHSVQQNCPLGGLITMPLRHEFTESAAQLGPLFMRVVFHCFQYRRPQLSVGLPDQKHNIIQVQHQSIRAQSQKSSGNGECH